mgnify:CR=1 FL=1
MTGAKVRLKTNSRDSIIDRMGSSSVVPSNGLTIRALGRSYNNLESGKNDYWTEAITI